MFQIFKVLFPKSCWMYLKTMMQQITKRAERACNIIERVQGHVLNSEVSQNESINVLSCLLKWKELTAGQIDQEYYWSLVQNTGPFQSAAAWVQGGSRYVERCRGFPYLRIENFLRLNALELVLINALELSLVFFWVNWSYFRLINGVIGWFLAFHSTLGSWRSSHGQKARPRPLPRVRARRSFWPQELLHKPRAE